MSGLKNSPFGKRLRASHQDNEDDGPRRNRPRINPMFYTATPSSTKDTTPESPVATRDMYGDRFIPSRDTGDMRTTYHLMDESGPFTPSKTRIIPTESDALKGESSTSFGCFLSRQIILREFFFSGLLSTLDPYVYPIFVRRAPSGCRCALLKRFDSHILLD
jgi:cell division cycle 20-like protein 1 (cofactor of APC complex)